MIPGRECLAVKKKKKAERIEYPEGRRDKRLLPPQGWGSNFRF